MSDKKEKPVMTAINEDFDNILRELSEDVRYLEDITLGLDDPDCAYKYLVKIEDSSRLVQLLLSLQRIHSVIIGMHPESPYTGETKKSFIYEKIISISEETVKFIDVTLDVYQYFKSIVPPYLANKEYCYNLVKSPIEGTWSFYGLLLRILSNCRKLLPYLQYLKSFEYVKGYASMQRSKGTMDAGPKPPPPPSEDVLDEI